MPSRVFDGVVALFQPTDPLLNSKAAIQSRLVANGARIMQRIGKDVTHVVFERKRSQRPSDKTEEEAIVAELYRKLDALPYPPMVVSPLWVEDSIEQNRRQIETRYTVARPKENPILTKPLSPRAASSGKRKRQNRSSAAAPPAPSATYDLDPSDWVSSSSQQLEESKRVSAGVVAAPTRGNRLRRRPAHRKAASAREMGGTGKTMKKNLKTDPDMDILHAGIGSATQAVADILAIDLPGEERMGDGVGDSDEELDTPLSVRMARSRFPNDTQRPVGAKSRLAKASGPAAKGENGPNKPPTNTKTGVPAGQRFSVRQLYRNPQRPVALHKGTPPPGVLASPSGNVVAEKSHSAAEIPIPLIQSVPSPWDDSIIDRTHFSHMPASQEEDGGGGSAFDRRHVRVTGQTRSTAKNAGTPWTMLKQINSRPVLPSPWSTARPWDAAAPKVIADYSARGGTKRSRLGSQSDRAGTANPERFQESEMKELEDAANVMPSCSGDQWPQTENNEEQSANKRKKTIARKRTQPKKCSGVMTVTSVNSAMTTLARYAATALGGLRMCADGREDGRLTHLVIGEDRRTMKAMLAVANGGYFLSPEWITASLEAGKWLPESEYPAKVRFAEASERCRRHMAASKAPLLSEHCIYVDPGRKKGASKIDALKRVAEALGATTVGGMASCTLCIMPGEHGRRPRELPRSVPAVTEEWLLQAAETFKVPAIKKFQL